MISLTVKNVSNIAFNSTSACLKIYIFLTKQINVHQFYFKSSVALSSDFHLNTSVIDRKGKESAAMKADLLRARDMKRYINQLTVAKKQCEKRIRVLGGPNYENNEEGGADDSDEPQSQKVRLG